MPMRPAGGKFEIKGAKATEQVLKKLPNAMRGRVLRAAASAGGRVVRDTAKLSAPVGETGETRESIAVRTQKESGRNSVTVRVGPTRRAFYAFFGEFGTSNQPARPWFRPAWDASKGRALNKIGDSLGKAITRAAKRLAGPLLKSGLVRGAGKRKRGRR